MAEMTAEIAAILRAPFKDEEIGKLPKLTCKACREARGACNDHKKTTCRNCRNFISTAHIDIDYVGHAETTDRLLQADPEWTWEPVAWAADGLPQIDPFGGLWIRLTVAGVTRIGYGHADGKRGADAIKETIGDALRNAAMRFGVALDLWGAKFDQPIDAEPAKTRRRKPADDTPAEPPTTEPEPDPASTTGVTQDQHKIMHALWNTLGYGGDANRETRLAISAQLLRLSELRTSSHLTFAQAEQLIDRLRARISEKNQQGAQ